MFYHSSLCLFGITFMYVYSPSRKSKKNKFKICKFIPLWLKIWRRKQWPITSHKWYLPESERCHWLTSDGYCITPPRLKPRSSPSILPLNLEETKKTKISLRNLTINEVILVQFLFFWIIEVLPIMIWWEREVFWTERNLTHITNQDGSKLYYFKRNWSW